MFGLFTKKPPADLQNALGLQGHSVSESLSYVIQWGQLPPHQAYESNPICVDDKADQNSLTELFIEVVTKNGLAHVDTDERLEAINNLAREILAPGQVPERIMDGVLFLLTSLNSVDTIARIYYRDFPEYRPLFDMVNQLAKIVPPALDRIFKDDVPTELREAFPQVSGLIEQYRSNG